MTIHTGSMLLKRNYDPNYWNLGQFRAFSSELGQFRTKIEIPDNIGNCEWPVCGPDSSSCQTARTIAFGANREAITLGQWLKIIVKCPLVNMLDSLWIKTILRVFRGVNCFKPEKGERINNIHFYFIKLEVEQLVKITCGTHWPNAHFFHNYDIVLPSPILPRRAFSWGWPRPWLLLLGRERSATCVQFQCFPLYFLK